METGIYVCMHMLSFMNPSFVHIFAWDELSVNTFYKYHVHQMAWHVSLNNNTTVSSSPVRVEKMINKHFQNMKIYCFN